MRLEHESQKLLEKKILEVIGSHVNLRDYQVFFFGSRVEGGGDERSDIDVGIEGKKPLPLPVMARIKEEISELPILYRIDVIDFRMADKIFREIAKRKIEVFSPQSKGRL